MSFAVVGGALAASLPGRSISAAAASTQRAAAATSGLATPTDLGTRSFGRIIVDPATSHIFVSSPGDSQVVVLDYNGAIVKTITNEAGAFGMALSGSTLYVVLSTAGAIEKIDTGDLNDKGPLVSGLIRPTDLIWAGSKLWTTTGNCAAWEVKLVSVDPSTNPPTVVVYPNAFQAGGLAYCAGFASNPASNPNFFVAFDIGLSPSTMATFNVSTGSPVMTAGGGGSPLGNLQDVAVNPGGQALITASGAPYEFDEWKVSDLRQDGIIYPANPYPTAIATTPGNGGLMGGGLDASYEYDFYVYPIGKPAKPLVKVDFGGSFNTVPHRGVAFKPDGSRAFVISGGSGGPYSGEVYVNLVPIAPLPPPGSPSEPTTVSASPGIGSATVSWNPPSDPGSSPVTSYRVTSSPGGIAATTSNTSTVVNGLTPGVSYTFTVTATNAAGTGPPSAPSNAVVPWICGPPTNVTATPGDSAAYVSWQPPANPGGPISAYTVTPYIGTVAQTSTTVSGAPPLTNVVVTGLTSGATYTFVVTATVNGAPSQPSAPSNAVTPIQGGNYHPLTPARILDTRIGLGSPTLPIRNAETRAIQITGRGNVPASDVSAVVMNVTVTGPTAAGYLTVYPMGVTRPVASNLNFVAGQTVPNLVEVAVGDGGTVDLFAEFAGGAGRADVIFDVAGWVGVATNSMVKDGLYNPLTPARIMDTRTGLGVRKGAVGAGQLVTLNLFNAGGVPSSGVSAVILNVTVTGPTAPSYVTVYPADAQRPTASNLNFTAGQTVPNRVIVKLGAGGQVSFYNAAGNVHVIADVGGWFTDSTSNFGGARFTGVPPYRFVDSRDPAIGPLDGGTVYQVGIVDHNGDPITGVSAVVFNVTATNPTAASFLTLWPDGPLPPVSDLNFTAGQTVPNLVVLKLGPNATFNIYNAAGRTDIVMDVVGYYGSSVAAPSRPFSHVLRAAPLRERSTAAR